LNVYHRSELRKLKRLEPLLKEKGRGCVYFLFDENTKLLYVGKSRKPHSRLLSYVREKVDFEYFTFLLPPLEKMGKIESEYIKKYRPPLNNEIKITPFEKWKKIGREAKKLHKRISDFLNLIDSVPKTERREFRKVSDHFQKLRSDLEDRMFKEHPQKASTGIFFGKLDE